MQSLSSLVAERKVMDSLSTIRAKQVKFDAPTVMAIAHKTLTKKRVATALHYLEVEYGERDIPPTELIDKLFGLDIVITYRGWTIGLDITLNPEALGDKLAKLHKLAHAHTELGVDKTAVLLVTGDVADLQSVLSQIIKSDRPVALVL
jgi:hypothetical protein